MRCASNLSVELEMCCKQLLCPTYLVKIWSGNKTHGCDMVSSIIEFWRGYSVNAIA